ncbi:hypothetical protein STEG23_016794 [Scotinomys teguina]
MHFLLSKPPVHGAKENSSPIAEAALSEENPSFLPWTPQSLEGTPVVTHLEITDFVFVVLHKARNKDNTALFSPSNTPALQPEDSRDVILHLPNNILFHPSQKQKSVQRTWPLSAFPPEPKPYQHSMTHSYISHKSTLSADPDAIRGHRSFPTENAAV